MVEVIYKKIEKIKEWSKLKVKVEKRSTDWKYFKEQEVWWANLGINIGFEQDGKNRNCERPVLIFKKFNKNFLWILPLTTRIKKDPHYFFLDPEKERDIERGSIILSQIRAMSSKRLRRKMGKLSKEEFEDVKKRFIDII
ncbi:MAG: type II toxin-antitoxin system PemK/MazF family toxin [Candidatus Moranbacteria bacterium]|nr:type II toxin-antitoxin system PemK/MazF family toxin [Candidatus Moranbacteria bacterium]